MKIDTKISYLWAIIMTITFGFVIGYYLGKYEGYWNARNTISYFVETLRGVCYE